MVVRRKKSIRWKDIAHVPRPLFPKKPDGAWGIAHAKQRLINIAEIPKDLRAKLAHQHNFDIVANLGSVRSGKTSGTVALVRHLCRKYPGIKIIIGSMNYQHMLGSVCKEFAKILSIDSDWDHPDLIRHPTRYVKEIIFRNFDPKTGKPLRNSTVTFVNLSEPDRILSMECDVFIVEEAQKLPEDTLDKVIGRMSGGVIGVRQVILNANPDEEDLEWLRPRFSLDLLDPDFDGEIDPHIKLIKNKDIPGVSKYSDPEAVGTMTGLGTPCKCHLCNECRAEKVESEFQNGICPRCGTKKNPKVACPGKQYRMRVVLSSHLDNQENLVAGFGDDVEGAMSAQAVDAYARGLIVKRAGGKVYIPYGPKNIRLQIQGEAELNLNQNIIWHMDFNARPQCSGISQITRENGKIDKLQLIDELLVWDGDPIHVAEAFLDGRALTDGKTRRASKAHIDCSRPSGFRSLLQQGFKKSILIYGDPNGGHRKQNDPDMTNFIIIQNKLVEAGFKVHVITDNTKWDIEDRVKAVNHLLEEERLIFNRRCIFHQLSADWTVWNTTGTKESEKHDRKARDRAKAGERIGMSHPMAGIGYWIVQDYPLVPREAKQTSNPIVASLSSDVFYEIDPYGELIEKKFSDAFDDGEFDDLDAEDLMLERSEKEMEIKRREDQKKDLFRPLSIADMLRGQGLWNLPRK